MYRKQVFFEFDGVRCIICEKTSTKFYESCEISKKRILGGNFLTRAMFISKPALFAEFDGTSHEHTRERF